MLEIKTMTKQQKKLYTYLKRYNGERSTEQIVKYLKCEGKYARQFVYKLLSTLEDNGLIEMERVEPSRKITVL